MGWIELHRHRRYLKVTVDIWVTEHHYGNQGVKVRSEYYFRYETVFLQDLNVDLDKAYYWELKKSDEAKFMPGEWVLIRNGKLIVKTMDVREAGQMVSRQDGRFLLWQVGSEGV